jgi:hypothetical protein
MRTLLFKNLKFSSEFLGVIVSTYQELIVNWWPAKLVPQLSDPLNAQRVETKKSLKKQDIEKMHTEYIEWEKKQTAKEKYI